MKQKIGIITVHNNTNYGANLQAFASSAYLDKIGHDACIIDYTLPSHLKHTRLFPWLKCSWDGEPNKSISRKLKLGAALVLSAPHKYGRLKNFSSFRRKYIKMSEECKSVRDVAKLDLDTVICGSDQIWNPDITEGIAPIFFGDIDAVRKRISYAASVGKERYDASDEAKAIELINKIDYCSVREEQTAEYLSRITGREILTVCDPVFLLDKADYEAITHKRVIKGRYILLYSVVHNAEMSAVAKKYAEKRGLPLVEICSGKDKGASHRQISSYGPIEFLSAFRYADAVITNSFHGTAFSIIFEKNFYAFDNKHRGSRITNLLNKAGLTGRLISGNIEKEYPDIDYDSVKDNLLGYIDGSKSFLKRALESEKVNLAEDSCIGCGACNAVCARDAVRLVKSAEGFLESYIDIAKCVDCGLCKKVCPALNTPEKYDISNDVLAFKAEDSVRKNSTSGGAFAALAKTAIDEGGAVYGAKLENNRTVRHIRGTTFEDIASMQGTKYVQSDITECFGQLAEDLKDGIPVLFSGTPCQIDAVKSFTKAKKLNTDNLITVDIICHGVPSPKVYEDYIDWLEKEYSSPVKEYRFRSKEISWRGNSCMAILTDGREIKEGKKLNGFMNLYYSDNITRKSCYECKYTSKERVSDITVSDYWGIENVAPEFEDNLGVSMIIINTDKGKDFFSGVAGAKAQGSLEGIKQPQLSAPTKRPEARETFWKTYERGGVELVLKEYGGVRKDSLKQKIYNLIKG